LKPYIYYWNWWEDSFWIIAGCSKFKTLYFDGTNCGTSSVQIAIDSANGNEYFILKTNRAEFNWGLFEAEGMNILSFFDGTN